MANIQGTNLYQKFIISASPLVLGIFEIWHPVGSPDTTAFESIKPQVDWWLTLHLIQIPLFGLIAYSVVYLVRGLQSRAAYLCRIGMAIFIVFYPVLDSVTGIATGLIIRQAQNFSPSVQKYVSFQVNMFLTDPFVGGATFSAFGLLGALGWLFGLSSAAIALSRVGIPKPALFLLIAAGLLFSISHTPPTGPVGMMSLFLAVMIINARSEVNV